MGIEHIRKVCVVGGGLMGRQIALNTAMYGFEVYLVDTYEKVIEDVFIWSEKYLNERIAKGKMTEEKVTEIKSNFHLSRNLSDVVKESDLIIEAIIEDKTAKEDLFREISKHAKTDAIIATNSSYMFSSIFSHCVENPKRLANLHYFNPALVMKLTEVVQGPHTSDETVQTLLEFSRRTGKDPVWIKKEIDGFVANRIVRAVATEALYLLEQGIATAQEIDTAVEKGLNYPMGPFRLMDLTGVDLTYLAAKRQLEETGFRRPAYDILQQKYEDKEWGRKTGKGWYEYPSNK